MNLTWTPNDVGTLQHVKTIAMSYVLVVCYLFAPHVLTVHLPSSTSFPCIFTLLKQFCMGRVKREILKFGLSENFLSKDNFKIFILRSHIEYVDSVVTVTSELYTGLLTFLKSRR